MVAALVFGSAGLSKLARSLGSAKLELEKGLHEGPLHPSLLSPRKSG